MHWLNLLVDMLSSKQASVLITFKDKTLINYQLCLSPSCCSVGVTTTRTWVLVRTHNTPSHVTWPIAQKKKNENECGREITGTLLLEIIKWIKGQRPILLLMHSFIFATSILLLSFFFLNHMLLILYHLLYMPLIVSEVCNVYNCTLKSNQSKIDLSLIVHYLLHYSSQKSQNLSPMILSGYLFYIWALLKHIWEQMQRHWYYTSWNYKINFKTTI